MKIKQKNFYKIRHKSTGLFKLGGGNSNFGKIGKIWRGPTIKAHLQLFLYAYKSKRCDIITSIQDFWARCNEQSWRSKKTNFEVEDCEIVEYEMIEKQTQPLSDFLKKEMDKS